MCGWRCFLLCAAGLGMLAGPPRLAAQAHEPPAGLVAALRRVAVPIRSSDPSAADAELEPLLPLLRGRQIVAMGEATHGTHEFFRLKHRFFSFLVRRAGFRTFALEALPRAVRPADAYVQGGGGSADDAARALWEWPWETREMAALFEWVRGYNASVPESARVHLRGIDYQGSDRDAHMADNVRALVEREGTRGGVFLWAHNAHVSTAPGWMGAYLRRAFGRAYYVIGFDFDDGDFLSKSLVGAITGALTTYHVAPASPRYYAYTLARLPAPVEFLDLAGARREPLVAAWLEEPRLSRQMDEFYNVRRLRERWITRDQPLPSLYDALLFVRHTSASRPLP